MNWCYHKIFDTSLETTSHLDFTTNHLTKRAEFLEIIVSRDVEEENKPDISINDKFSLC